MCGICGVFELGSNCPPARETLERMTDTIKHRGPDDAGYFFAPGIGLGHRRLSIIDLSLGHQPQFNEDGTIAVVFNGEIYNYLELRAFLQSKGHTFRTNSDTEAIVHLYEEFGEHCFAKLRGMFSIALWDKARQQLILARDRIGKKPLFYSVDRERVVFGSELKSVLAHPDVDDQLNLSALADYFCFLYIPSPQTIYKAVKKVRPAHYLVINSREAREECYWDLSFGEVEPDISEEDWCERIREAFAEAVRVRLMSEVPLGAFLSGGIDSSAVVCQMSRLMEMPVTACAIGFDEKAFSELEHARVVAQHIKADYHESMVRPRATEVVERLARHYDEPFADSSAIPTYYVSKAAREHVTVALSGDGGDENFAGYRRYYYDARENRMRGLVPGAVRRHVFSNLGRLYPDMPRAPRVLRAKSTLQAIGRDPLEGYLASITIAPWLREPLLSGDLRGQLRDYDPLEQFREHYRRADTNDLLSRIQYLDIKTYLTDDICVKVDRASMAVSLEVRAPLLDHKLMELVARIPSGMKLRNKEGKYIFKKAVAGILPPPTLKRGKQGFGVPVAEWFRGELKEWASDILFHEDGVFDTRHLRRIWNDHQEKVRDYSALLWAVFMFRHWQAAFPSRSDYRALTAAGCPKG